MKTSTAGPFNSTAFEAHLKTQAELLLRECPPNLKESILYSLLLPGKRIRPRLSFASGSLFELPEDVRFQAGAAVEMIHCFTLIHDDLPSMDNDDFRRGRPSNHKVYGDGLALLAGDSLAFMGARCLLNLKEVTPENLLQAVKRLQQNVGPEGVCGGQAAEMLLGAQSKEIDVRVMHARKTGALFLASVLIPAHLAGVSETSESFAALLEFAAALGLSFQLADDLDDASQDKTRSSTNLLTYLNKTDACAESFDTLTRSIGELKLIWPDRSSELIQIANEVIKTLQLSQEHSS